MPSAEPIEAARIDVPAEPPIAQPIEARPRAPSIPVLDVVLDPDVKEEPSTSSPVSAGGISPRRTAAYGLLVGLLVIGGIFAGLIGRSKARSPAFAPSVVPPLPSVEGAPSSKVATSAVGSVGPPPVAVPPAMPSTRPTAGPWRVSQLEPSPDLKIVEGTLDRRPLVMALLESSVPRAQVYRLLSAFNGVHK